MQSLQPARDAPPTPTILRFRQAIAWASPRGRLHTHAVPRRIANRTAAPRDADRMSKAGGQSHSRRR